MTQTWLFQGNPNLFRIDDYLATRPARLTWVARQRRREMRLGDQVFLWKSQLRGDRATSGIVAECIIEELPIPRPQETQARPFWNNYISFRADEPRVLLEVARMTEKGQSLLRVDLKADPLLAAMDILVRPRGTNFLLNAKQAVRLNERWIEHWMRHGRA